MVEQFGAERDFAVLAALALADVDDHAFLVDVFGPQVAQLGAAHAGGVKRHEDGAVPQIGGGVDQAGHFIRAEDGGDLTPQQFGQRQVVAARSAASGPSEEEAERGTSGSRPSRAAACGPHQMS